MFKGVKKIQLYDPYLVQLVNDVSQIEDRRPASCARYYLTIALKNRLTELKKSTGKEPENQ